MIVNRRICAHANELPHRCMTCIRSGHVRHLPPRHVHGDQRIAVDINVNRVGNSLLSPWSLV